MENKEELKIFLEQHEKTYRNAVIENIKNNTDMLVDQDIVSLLKKPPLDSMDLIRGKLLDLAKSNKLVLNTEELGVLLDNYRSYLLDCCDEIKNIRITELSSIIDKEKLVKNTDVLKLNKKDFMAINKKVKKLLKDKLNSGYKNCILENISNVFNDSIDESVKNKLIDDVTKFVNGGYQRQLLDNLDIKILVKDTTLINVIKEQGERYIFTLNNSRLLNEMDS